MESELGSRDWIWRKDADDKVIRVQMFDDGKIKAKFSVLVLSIDSKSYPVTDQEKNRSYVWQTETQSSRKENEEQASMMIQFMITRPTLPSTEKENQAIDWDPAPRIRAQWLASW